MSGHSKWATIKRHKAAQDSKRGAAFAKLTREIIMASKLGGADPTGNFRLRAAIDKAKSAGVTKDTIEQAVQKGQGKGGNSDNLESLTYEGYGPGGVAILIDATTDNRNRTAGDLRSYFNKYQGNFGETGCVGWMFTEKALVIVAKSSHSEDQLMELGLDAGLEDIETTEEEYILTTTAEYINPLCQVLADNNVTVLSTEITRVAQTQIELNEVHDEAILKPLLKLLDAIEAHDDVNEVHANVVISETADLVF